VRYLIQGHYQPFVEPAHDLSQSLQSGKFLSIRAVKLGPQQKFNQAKPNFGLLTHLIALNTHFCVGSLQWRLNNASLAANHFNHVHKFHSKPIAQRLRANSIVNDNGTATN
jgi:hypothetical protein